MLQAELIRKAQLPHEIFPIHVLPGLLLGSAQPRHTDRKPAVGLFPNASAVACLVTTSVSVCCNSCSLTAWPSCHPYHSPARVVKNPSCIKIWEMPHNFLSLHLLENYT